MKRKAYKLGIRWYQWRQYRRNRRRLVSDMVTLREYYKDVESYASSIDERLRSLRVQFDVAIRNSGDRKGAIASLQAQINSLKTLSDMVQGGLSTAQHQHFNYKTDIQILKGKVEQLQREIRGIDG